MKLPGCQHVTSATCDFSSLEMNVYEEIKLRIRAEEGDSASPWHELDPFIPFVRGEKQLLDYIVSPVHSYQAAHFLTCSFA